MGPSGGSISDGRLAVLRELSIEPDRFVSLRQIHSRTIYRVTSVPEQYGREGDGMLGDNPDFVFGVTVADCMPIYIRDEATGAFALLHSGWRGTGIVDRALQLMRQDYGTRPGDVTVILGPAIGVCCYRVDGPRAQLFAREWGEESVRYGEDGVYLDLLTANVRMLTRRAVGHVICIDL